MGFWEWLTRDDFKIAQRDLSAGQEAGRSIALAASRNHQVECKVCNRLVSELAPVCPYCGEPLPGLRIQCANCPSYHVAIDKKGFSVGQAAAGAIAVGPLGLAAGMIGSKDSRLVCLSCNYRWRIEKPKGPIGQERNVEKPKSPIGEEDKRRALEGLRRNVEKPKAPTCRAGIITDEAGNPVECQVCHRNSGEVGLHLTDKGKVFCAVCACTHREKAGKVVSKVYPRAKRLETPYRYRDDIGKYRCEYCLQIGRHRYNKTLKGIEKHIREHPVHD